MVEHFGGLSEYWNAPYQLVERHKLVWASRQTGQAKQREREKTRQERDELARLALG